ncbi:hypothetical protein [Jannaschia aquimarina]|uniref:Lysozyme inhibitor LprI N-terminal domain-containing protein n=1 Tax=Jannaschia aquimarina TaxID=935700 RepID=A0A0D1EK93_9RHOB|nr:hypothetical protein [Jannaschia aquimarina]KIT17431.1 hypothetical protein jaqu_08460 [Jannaschia aquimarina]SNT23933.1 hypothetical protein SAMN05421775_108156 [Jannaschia aquimarina]
MLFDRAFGVACALAAATLSSPAVAQDLSRFEACIGPELEARSKLIAYAAPCVIAGECPEGFLDDWTGWASGVETQCAARQFDDCAVSDDPAACLGALSTMLEAERAAIAADLTDERIAAAAEQAGGFRGRSVGRNVGMIRAPETSTCPPTFAIFDDALSLAPGTSCKAFDAMARWSSARMYLRMVEKAEASLD